ncbi:MAG: hypothetical protein ACYTGW_00765 [Planctomycetota bacterium]|jgi:hypothetical protein
MNRKEFLEAFFRMSKKDRDAIREALAQDSEEHIRAHDIAFFKDCMAQMMKKLEAGGDALALCEEVMAKCASADREERTMDAV